MRYSVILILALAGIACGQSSKPLRPRARALGVRFDSLETGPWNAITDVEGVAVGHATLIEGESVRTGVTVIIPRLGESTFLRKLPAAVFTGNGFGKACGFTQVEELGTLEAPIALTNTLSVGTVLEAMVRRMLEAPGHETVRSVNVVIGETNDGWLNDIRGLHVAKAHVDAAWDAAKHGPVPEGAVGAGTGTMCFGLKGGIGTASRVIPRGGYRLGVLVQANFGGRLRIAGRPIERSEPKAEPAPPEDKGSCMIVVATDAPLDARQLRRIARRAVLGLGRIGSVMAHGSGDYVIAFSTFEGNLIPHEGDTPRQVTVLPEARLTTFFEATVGATEEAVLNALLAARPMRGRDGHEARALDPETVRRALDR